MSSFIINPTAKILLVEDTASEILLVQKALNASEIKNSVEVVNDGEEAILYLKKQGKYSKATTPDLILLDLNLPKKNGCEVLSEIKEDKALRCIPVVMLSNSENDQDIFKTYYNHSNCFISKPVNFDKFRQMMELVMNFWFTVVKLPRKCF